MRTSLVAAISALALAGCQRQANIGALGPADSGPADAPTGPVPGTDAAPSLDGQTPPPILDAASDDANGHTDAGPLPSGDGGTTPQLASLCPAAHWCWENPRPQGNDLLGGWVDPMSVPTRFVGEVGTIVETKAGIWGLVPSPAPVTLYSAWRGWVAGDQGTLLDDHQTPVQLPRTVAALYRVWGFVDTGEAWVVGSAGAAFHFDGASWSDRSIPISSDIHGIFGAAPNDVWAVGDFGAIAHWDGAAWSVRAPDPGIIIDLRAVWGSAANDIWAVGRYRGEVQRPTIIHYDGSTWTALAPPAGPMVPLVSITGTDPNDIWAVGYHSDSVERELAGVAYHRSQGTWTEVPVPTTLPLEWVGSGGSGVWATGRHGLILHLEGGAWRTISSDVSAAPLAAIWGSSSSDVYVVGNGSLIHSDGSGSWSPVITGSSSTSAAIWGSGPDDIWTGAANGSVLLHFDGAAWTGTSPAPINVSALWGSGPNDVWGGSAYAKLLHYDGQRWNVLDSPGNSATNGLWGSASNDVWGASNGAGVLSHWDGNTWSMVQLSDLLIPNGISGTARDDVWIAGYQVGAGIDHFDGTSWTRSWSGGDFTSTDQPNGIFARTRSDAWAPGTGGLMLHWDGAGWSKMHTGVSRNLVRAWGTDLASLWVIGEAGTILRYRP